MRGLTRFRRILQNTRRLASPVAAILIYHRVTDLPVDVHNLAVSPKHFAQHLEIIRERYVPMNLSGLAYAMKENCLPRRSVVITFDDGYADNLHQARPLLEAYQTPATIFVVSGGVNSAREFWWDELERILLRSKNLPGRLILSIQDNELRCPTTHPGERQDALKAIRQRIRHLPSTERDTILASLARWANTDSHGRPEYLPMRSSELCLLAQSEFIEIGAHTRTHPVLAALPPEEQLDEINGSRFALERVLEKPVQTFSYPFGNPGDFTAQTAELVKAAGFTAAVTTIQGGVEAGDDLFQLKRCEVNDWDGETFRSKLSSFFYA
jgi:peptidoglycan/xylan/chitin deacetylase (PgdA/CDA1 family)